MLSERAEALGTVPVLVSLRTPYAPERQLSEPERGRQRAEIAAATDGLKGRVARSGGRVTATYQTVPWVALDASVEMLRALEEDDSVAQVVLDEIFAPALDDTVGIVEAQNAVTAGYDGSGYSVAILDTGVDARHPGFAGRIVAEACFSTDLCPTNDRGEILTSGPGSGAPCTDPRVVTECGHGTGVAGVAAGARNNGSPGGVAPGASIVAIQVFSTRPASTEAPCPRDQTHCTGAATRDLVGAFDWLRLNQGSFPPLAAINMSLGALVHDSDGTLADSCRDFPYPAPDQPSPADGPLGPLAEEMTSRGIAVVASAGNDSEDDQNNRVVQPVGRPACLPGVVSVGATTDADNIAVFSNSSAGLDLLAPGDDVRTAAPGGGSQTVDGTSFAAPHVAGAFAMLRQAAPNATVGELLDALKQTGTPILDSASGVEASRIAVMAAVDAVDPPGYGYWFVASDGGVFTYGGAAFHGSTGDIVLNEPVVGMAPTRTGKGYWLVARDGGIFAFGDAGFHGSTGAIELNHPIIAMAPAPDDGGYWLIASDGGVFSFGTARFHGSGVRPSGPPFVALAPTPSGQGYWLVDEDATVFSFGDARSLGEVELPSGSARVKAAQATPSGRGLWMTTSTGTVFPLGDARDYGDLRAQSLNKPVVGMAAPLSGRGYWMVGGDGGVFSFGDAGFFGSTGNLTLNKPVVGMSMTRQRNQGARVAQALVCGASPATEVACPDAITRSDHGFTVSYSGPESWAGVAQMVPAGAETQVSGTVDASTLAGSAAAVIQVSLADSTRRPLATVSSYRTGDASPLDVPSDAPVSFAAAQNWVPQPEPHGFRIDVALLLAEHLPSVDPAEVAFVTVRFLSYAGGDSHGGVTFSNVAVVGTGPSDVLAPVTTAEVSPAPNAAGWHREPVTVRLVANDDQAVSAITYRAAGAGAVETSTIPGPTATLVIAAEGETTVFFSSLDTAGNAEAEQSLTVRIDRSEPIVAFGGNAGTYTVDRDVAITCTATDTLSGVASHTCTDLSAPAWALELGAHTIAATALDVAGNQGFASTSFSVEVTYDSLSVLTARFVTHPGTERSLIDKLVMAATAASNGDEPTRLGALSAYANELAAQNDKKVSPEYASVLQRLAGALR